MIKEQIHTAAHEDLDEEAVAEILLQHRDKIQSEGLTEHAGIHATRIPIEDQLEDIE